MDPVVMIIVPGFVGGLVIALLIARLNRRPDAPPYSSRDQPPPTDVINMARIRVAGIGGLGFVAMAIVVALAIPRIGGTLAAGLVLGALFAIILIGWRRRTGPMPSSGRRPGANTALSIDTASPEGPHDGQDSTDVRDDSPDRRASRYAEPPPARRHAASGAPS